VINGGFVKHEIPIIKIPFLFSVINSQRFHVSFLFDIDCLKEMLYMLRQMLYETVFFDVYKHKIVLRSSGNTHTQINIHSLTCEKKEGGGYQVMTEHQQHQAVDGALLWSCGPFQIENLLLFFKKKFKTQLVLTYLREDAICFESSFIESEQNRKRHKTFTNIMTHMNQTLACPAPPVPPPPPSTNEDTSHHHPLHSIVSSYIKYSSETEVMEQIHHMNQDYHNHNSFKLLYSVFANPQTATEQQQPRNIISAIDEEVEQERMESQQQMEDGRENVWE
jgi:hypothetical protein